MLYRLLCPALLVSCHAFAAAGSAIPAEVDAALARAKIPREAVALLVLDADSGKILATFPIGAGNDAAKFDPGRRLAFASNGDGTLTVIHEDSPDKFSLVQNVKTEPGARTMAVDPKTHRLFMPTADFGPPPPPTPEKPNPHGPIIPGSFRLLVLEP